jgi:hypothetical protein
MPTKCIPFGRVKSKEVLADFSGERVSSDAGVLLLARADRKLGLIKNVAAAIEDRRHGGYIEHSFASMIRQRVFGICCGHEDGNDHAFLRDDPLFRAAAGVDPLSRPLASPSTLSRFENSVTRPDLIAMSRQIVESFIGSFKRPPRRLVLDFDATDDRIHGNQEGAFFHGYYDAYCFLPLYVFCGDRLLVSYLRPCNIDASKHAWAILALLVKRLRQEWPQVQIVLRADSGFCRDRLLKWCDRTNVGYVVGLARNTRLYAFAKSIVRKSQRLQKKTGRKTRVFGEIRYAAYTWSAERRVIVKAEQLEKGENLRYVVTNLPDIEPQELYDGVYVERGEMENRIKEQQLDLFADRTSCSRFLANQFRLLLSSVAYILALVTRS